MVVERHVKNYLSNMLPKIEYHEEIQEPPHLIMVDHIECFEFPFENLKQEEFKHLLELGGTSPRTKLDAKEEIYNGPIEETCEEPLIEDIVKDCHVFMEVSECPQDSLSEEDDHICTIDLSQEETILEAYNETYDEICNEHNDDSLEGLLPCDLFLKKMNMIMRRDITRDVIPARKTLSYLT